MKKFLLLIVVALIVGEAYSQTSYRVKNRYDTVIVDTTLGGVWGGPEYSGQDVADSVYFSEAGMPNYYDLNVPDLEIKMKALWYRAHLYVLVRRMDDSLVNGYANGAPDVELKEGLENRDATAFYLLKNQDLSWEDPRDSFYDNNGHLDSIVWFRWGVETDEFEGGLLGDTINSISEVGGELVQWKQDGYYYSKFSMDFGLIDSSLVVKETISIPGTDEVIKGHNINTLLELAFEVEVNENDKEVLDNGLYGMQTRVFFGGDHGSNPTEPFSVSNWGVLDFTFGDTVSTALKSQTVDLGSVYPNPASDRINIQFDSYYEAQYRIYSQMGQQMLSGTLLGRDNVIELDDLGSGIYYLNIITSDGKLMSEKLLILK